MPIVEPVDENLKELEGIHLWHAPLSSCSQRVRITLAEKGLGFISHLIDLHAGEHATEEYQRIHPNGLVPALVIDGELIIESVDIIKELERRFESPSLRAPGARLDAEMQLAMKRANAAQPALKLLTFEFLFRAAPTPPKRNVIAFQNNHKNDALKKFHRDFAAGFKRDRIVSAAADAHSDFRFLDSQLRDYWMASGAISEPSTVVGASKEAVKLSSRAYGLGTSRAYDNRQTETGKAHSRRRRRRNLYTRLLVSIGKVLTIYPKQVVNPVAG
jgi:glutathione S-transferase